MTIETATKHAIKDYLNLKSIFWWYSLQGLGAQKGVPDMFALKDGVLYGIEVKTPTGRLSTYQEEFLKRIDEAGGKGIVARSLDDVIAVL